MGPAGGGVDIPELPRDFDPNTITPGTAFMARISAHLDLFFRQKLECDPTWQHLLVRRQRGDAADVCGGTASLTACWPAVTAADRDGLAHAPPLFALASPLAPLAPLALPSGRFQRQQRTWRG